MIRDEYVEEIQRILDHNLGNSLISRSAYDTARVAQLHPFIGSDIPIFPESIEWLTTHQNADGSWGEDANGRYVFDKHLATLATIAMFRHWSDRDWGHYDILITSGLDYLHATMHSIQEQTHYRPIAFELIFPTLIEDLQNLGFVIPEYPSLESILLKRADKLRRLPPQLITSQVTTAYFSLEGFRGMQLDWWEVLKNQDALGSFSGSPSSSAFMFAHTGDLAIIDYLKSTLVNGAAPANFPIELYERVWSMDIITKLGLQNRVGINRMRPHLEHLERHWKPGGISWTAESQINDLDDTSQLFYVFNKFGMAKSPSVWSHFYDGHQIFCFPGENDPAPSHLLHLMQTLEGETWQGAAELRALCLSQIETTIAQRGIFDKWHASEFYTLHLLIPIFLQYRPALGKEFLALLLEKQDRDGSWGYGSAVFEETALSCYGLFLTIDSGYDLPPEALKALDRGIKFLEQNFTEHTELPPLWVSKVLYRPTNLVQVMINAVLARSNTNY